MAKYKLIESGVFNRETGTFIPQTHWMYHDYELWISEGNIPDPLDIIINTPVYKCSPWQIRKLLNNLGLRQQVELAIKNSNNVELQDGWEFASEWVSDSPYIPAMCAIMEKTEEEIIELIREASLL